MIFTRRHSAISCLSDVCLDICDCAIIFYMHERDIRAVENLARAGMSFDDLRKSFPEFSIEEVEKIYMRIRKERNNAPSNPQSKINCS